MNSVSSANTPEDSIDPSLRKKRGPQEDKREQETRERPKKAGLKPDPPSPLTARLKPCPSRKTLFHQSLESAAADNCLEHIARRTQHREIRVCAMTQDSVMMR